MSNSCEYLNLKNGIYQGDGMFDIPKLDAVDECLVNKWIGFNWIKKRKMDGGVDASKLEERKVLRSSELGVQFFLDDLQLERLWNNPFKYVDILKNYKAVLTPDFSLYKNFPKAVQIFNTYRKNWLGRFWQNHGLTVIPTISWSDEESFNWCLDGTPHHSVIAISNVGNMRSYASQRQFRKDYQKVVDVLEPSLVLFFHHKKDNYPGNIRWIDYDVQF